ncbi:MAG: hypothetical protein K9N23_13145 [Akkermansiaceae bacterium]|nr:hypothetical protein [Akkermansiaceae bacterium]
MKPWQRLGVLAAGLLAAGALRLPVEARWSEEMRAAGLLRQGLQVETKAKIGQTFYAVALGGLRTLVATFFNLRTIGCYESLDWGKMDEIYQTMVTLAPRTGEYWIAGAHSQAMNAASYYRNDTFLEMSPLDREANWRAAVLRGREFAEQGTLNVPDDWKLQAFLGLLLTDRHKYRVFGDPDATFEAAARAYRAGADAPDALPFMRRFEMYSLARVESRRGEALELARKLYADPASRNPLLQKVCFALEVWANPTVVDPLALAVEVFGSEQRAYRELSQYWLHGGAGLPMNGVAIALAGLEAKLDVPAAESVLQQSVSRGRDGQDLEE